MKANGQISALVLSPGGKNISELFTGFLIKPEKINIMTRIRQFFE